jgi:hypothetical protein
MRKLIALMNRLLPIMPRLIAVGRFEMKEALGRSRSPAAVSATMGMERNYETNLGTFRY